MVTERGLGAAIEETTVIGPAEERVVHLRESRLIRDYQKYLGRPLVIHTIALPTGERLVTDGYDSQVGLLLEAKASTRRQDIRMAIGQLLDYRRHLTPEPKLAVLLPSAPSTDLVDLLAAHHIAVIHQTIDGFATL